MKTLELKHLAPYWPYKLKIHHGAGYSVDLSTKRHDAWYEGVDIQSVITLDYFKPILRPLSDLTKEDANNYNYVDENHLERSLLCGHAPFNVWLEFVKDHFDVFGLIEKGLAIDINRIKS